ncbi:MAG TPA: glycosyl hydrolase family 28-related protein [Trichormus sp.]
MAFANKNIGLIAGIALVMGLACTQRAEAAKTFNVQTYGARGDGSTDDQQALFSVFLAASETPNSIVFFPAGTYLHSGPLTLGGTATIQGASAVDFGPPTLEATGLAQVLTLTGSNTVSGMILTGQELETAIQFSNVGGVKINQCSFQGYSNCISMTNAKDAKLTNNTFVPAGTGTAVSITSSSGITVQNNTFTGSTGQTGVQCGGDNIITDANKFSNFSIGVNATNSKTARVDNNTFTGCQTVLKANGPDNLSITGNTCSNGNVFFEGSGAATKSLLVANNSVNMFTTGFNNFVNNSEATISSNTIKSVSTFLASSGNTSLSIVGNNISFCTQAFTSQHDRGIKIIQNTMNLCTTPIDLGFERSVQIDKNTISAGKSVVVALSSDVAVTANQLTNMQQQGVYSSQNTAVTIDANKISNCGLSGSSFNPAAVIYSDGSGTLVISNNTYSGNTHNLSYFIETPIKTAEVRANKTNTMLPNKIGP